MKSRQIITSVKSTKSKVMTLGDLIAAAYDARGDKEACKILEFAMVANVIKSSRPKFAVLG